MILPAVEAVKVLEVLEVLEVLVRARGRWMRRVPVLNWTRNSANGCENGTWKMQRMLSRSTDVRI